MKHKPSYMNFDVQKLIGKNLEEIENYIWANHLDLKVIAYHDNKGNPIAWVLEDFDTGINYDMYFGGFGEGHAFLPLTLLDPINFEISY